MTLIGPTPGDDRRSAWNRQPEIVAAEQRILMYADGLLQFMRRAVAEGGFTPEYVGKIEMFFTHMSQVNPFSKPDAPATDAEKYEGRTEVWLLEKLDPDNNRMLGELLRAAWELRNWKARYGEMTTEERDAL